MKTKLNALSAWLDRHALPLGAALAAALSLLLALYNVGGGPLGNLNDIGGWRNRALYIALTVRCSFSCCWRRRCCITSASGGWRSGSFC